MIHVCTKKFRKKSLPLRSDDEACEMLGSQQLDPSVIACSMSWSSLSEKSAATICRSGVDEGVAPSVNIWPILLRTLEAHANAAAQATMATSCPAS
jgi:hypothetical protein